MFGTLNSIAWLPWPVVIVVFVGLFFLIAVDILDNNY